MKVKLYKDGKLSEGEFDAGRLGDRVLYRTLKEAVDSYRANQRQGTVKTIGRDEVAGSRKKPWRQKHTGRARAGDRKSPIWRGGGTVFGPKPRDWSYRLPAKERRVALRSALYGKLADGEVTLVDLSGIGGAPSAKAARAVLQGSGALERAPGEARKVLLVTRAHDVVSARVVLAEEGALDLVAERVGAGAAADAGGAQ